MFKVVASNSVDWDEPPPQFAERDAAIGHARGLVGLLASEGAPADVIVSVLRGNTTEATYSVQSWRWAVKMVGDKLYA
jgi:hypothetical protein